MKVLVTGAGGFLGQAVCRGLLQRGAEVSGLARSRYLALEAQGIRMMRGDAADRAAVAAAVAGQEIVVHTAAKAGVWGPAAEYQRTNAIGTENILAACREAGVTRLVYTSSPSVVFTGRDQENLDESAPYPDRYEAAYPESKAAAERAVLKANGPDLATVALRPHLIWGPGDPHIAPRLVARARSGRLRIVGSGQNRVDATYIDNAAHAHLLAVERLAPGSPLAGRAYFIANGEPMPLWELVNGILAAHGVAPITRKVPAWVAVAAGTVCEAWHRAWRLADEPLMTRFVAHELATSHWFNLEAARRDLGYAPIVTVAEGLKRLAAAVQES
ncbi:MAG TPA: NAD-dependent epimerase/dehydratase family protein [Gemmatales bacterium]|nr:NAD-dependent epimerase/dehydratase family protein [Gemmatales bacterium]